MLILCRCGNFQPVWLIFKHRHYQQAIAQQNALYLQYQPPSQYSSYITKFIISQRKGVLVGFKEDENDD